MALIRRSGARARVTFFTAVTVIAATAALGLVDALAARYRARFDVTATGSQKLADRTRRVLHNLDKPYEVVIAADFSGTDYHAKERLVDVLEEFRRGSDQFDYSLLDIASPAGVRGYKELVKRLAARESEVIDPQVAALQLHMGGVSSLAAYLNDTVSPRLLEIESAIPAGNEAHKANRDYFNQAAAVARLASKDLAAAITKADAALRFKFDEVSIPQTDVAAAAIIAPLSQAVDQLAALAKELKRFAEARDSAGPAADAASGLIRELEQRRNQAAVILDSLRKLKRPDLSRVVEALRSGSTALVIGPREAGLCAIDVSGLMPSAAWLDATGGGKADQGRRIEELIQTALAGLRSPDKPIVVLMHGDPYERLGDNSPFTLLKQRLEFRGIDLVEWPVMLSQEPPRFAAIDPDRKRPVVYACMGVDSTTAASGRGQLSGVQRAEKVAQALEKVVAEGRSVLLSLSPSIVPTYGEHDPFEKVLEGFGLAAETGRPLLREQTSGGVRIVEPEMIVQADDDSSHVIGAAVRGLPAYFTWPIALVPRPSADSSSRPEVRGLYYVQAGPTVWLESQWLRLWQTPANQRASVPDLPRFDEGRDSRSPSGVDSGASQRWMIVATSEKSIAGRAPQRMVAVGSNLWIVDPIVGQEARIEGRRVMANPGNLELFENSVYWLAGQHDLIAQSPAARAAPIVSNIGETQLTRLRLALIIGLPALALLAGVIVRVIRG